MKKKKFIYSGPKEFYAEDWTDAENLLFDYLELSEDNVLTQDEIRAAQEDQAYQDHKEAI